MIVARLSCVRVSPVALDTMTPFIKSPVFLVRSRPSIGTLWRPPETPGCPAIELYTAGLKSRIQFRGAGRSRGPIYRRPFSRRGYPDGSGA